MKETRYVNHEKVELVKDYENKLSEIREYLSARAIIALDNTPTEIEVMEESYLMLNTVKQFEDLVNKHNCELNRIFCDGALIVIDDTRNKLRKKQDTALNLINLVLGLTVQLDYLMLDFRDKLYDNLK